MKAAAFFLAGLAAMTLSGVAQAQDTGIGSRLAPRQTVGVERDPAVAIRLAHGFFGCAAVKFPDAAKAYLGSRNPADLPRYWRRMFGAELSCSAITGQADFATDTRVSPPPSVARGLLAESLLAHMPAASPAPMPLARIYHADWNSVSDRPAVIDDMAMCVAAIDPAGIRRLLATIPASPAEGGAVGALGPDMGECLVANAKLSANREGLRAALAEALYHRIVDPAPAQIETAGNPAPVGK